MKYFVVLIAAGLLAGAIYAVAAPAGEQAVTPKQFAALSKKVTALQKELRAVENCALVQAIPIAQFGKSDGSEGYLYGEADGTTIDATTALDVSAASSAQAWSLVTNSDCASIINSGKKRHVATFHVHFGK